MAKRLYGAAARAHAKRMSAIKRKRKRPTKKRRGAARKRRSTTGKRKSAKRVAAGKKAARTRKRHAAARRSSRPVVRRRKRKSAKRSAAARRAAATRKRRAQPGHAEAVEMGYAKNPGRRRRRKAARRNPARRRRTYRRRNPRPTTSSSLMRARRSIRNRYKTPLGTAYKRRYKMRSNPAGMFMDTLKQAAPVAAGLYGSRFVSRFSSKIPGFNSLPAVAQGPVAAGLVVLGAHFLTKKVKPLMKYRGALLLGSGLNLIDQVVSAFAPDSLLHSVGLISQGDKVKLGLGEYHSVYDGAMSDYIGVGSTPIDDEITMSDYIEVGQLEEELGAMEELGMGAEEELGQDPNSYLGGVSSSSMLKQISAQPMVAAVPTRSFTREIARSGQGYDSPKSVYTGIFSGGFGN